MEKMEGSDTRERRRKLFIAHLERFGFQLSSDELWHGTVDVTWCDPGNGSYHRAQEPVSIGVPKAFPFAKPHVTPVNDDTLIADSLHREPNGGPACLWRDDESGWQPGMTLTDVLDRTREWFLRCRQGSWRADERPGDLHLYFPVTGVRTMVLISDDWQPAPHVSTGRFGVWQSNDLIAFAGSPGVGTDCPPQRHPDRVLAKLGLKDAAVRHHGIWFRLGREPQRVLTLPALFAMIDEACSQLEGWALAQTVGLLGLKNVRAQLLYVALGYPAADEGEHWLFLRCDFSSMRGRKWSQQDRLVSIPMNACRTALAHRAALMRRTGPLSRVATGRRVVVFGVGAIGSEIALLLAKTGISHLTLVDSDYMTPTNAVRHAADIRAAGLPKTLAVRDAIEAHAPDCAVQVHDATWDPDALVKLVNDADVVIDATARTTFSLLLNHVSVQEGIPVFYVTAHRRAGIGRLRVVRSPADACLNCYEAEDGYRGDPAYPLIPYSEEGAFIEEGCGTPTVEAAAINLAHTAATAARLVIDHLRGTAPEENHHLIVVEPIPEGIEPFPVAGVHSTCWHPLVGCEECGTARSPV
jgi:molybdopterin/thiamine biosynthesis adenylyltransferase